MNPDFGYHEQQQQQLYNHDHEQNALMNDVLYAEELYFTGYDHAMQLEADYFDQQMQHDHALNEESDNDNYNQYLASSNSNSNSNGDDDDDDNDDTRYNQQYEDDEMVDTVDTEYDYQDDTLLKLIVDVQLYISDMANVGVDRHDSPLVGLQYKMYTYLKQRANDMGMDASSLI